MKSLFFIVILFLSSCSGQCPIQAEAEINRILELQRQAWNNGNIDKFMQAYWHSDQLVFIGKSGAKYGWQSALTNYKQSYPNKQAMGELEFSELKVKKIAKNTMFATGKWQLAFDNNAKNDENSENNKIKNGYFSLIWQYLDGKWQIISDHSS